MPVDLSVTPGALARSARSAARGSDAPSATDGDGDGDGPDLAEAAWPPELSAQDPAQGTKRSRRPRLSLGHRSRGLIALNRSPLSRKIILFNILAMVVLVAGVVYLNPFRDGLIVQRERALTVEAQLTADIFGASLRAGAATDTPLDAAAVLQSIGLRDGSEVFVFAPSGELIASTRTIDATPARAVRGVDKLPSETVLLSDFVNRIWSALAGLVERPPEGTEQIGADEIAASVLTQAYDGVTVIQRGSDAEGTLFAAASQIVGPSGPAGYVVVTSMSGEIDQLVRVERERTVQVFVIALFVSIVLSLVLASAIANPLSDLASAAELGRDRNARKMQPTRVRIPDMTARRDEIGRLSGALRGMVEALYDRIDSNEQFAADVSHEIKNPLASLRSAVGTLRVAKTDPQRQRLLEVLEHDVRRLDRLVSDISNASRLDSELVKEEEEMFNLVQTLRNISEYHAQEAKEKGVDFITDLPREAFYIAGLEGRLAQVFVNLLSNAISFCEEGDAVRLWTRRRANRVLIVVEDTGPGIPEEALTKIFNRFYSQRPEMQFGNNSGLGLAISKQIVEAHGGVIWAENIRPTEADMTSGPLGARLVVGLPI